MAEARPPEHWSAGDQAAAVLAAGALATAPRTAEQRLALAWALKDACFAAWLSDPARTATAAQALAELAAQAARAEREGPAPEIDALAAWTAAIADLVRGAMTDAVAGFDRAAAAFVGLGQPLHAAQTQVPRIMALSFLGRHDEATACAEHTLAVFTQHGDRLSAAKVSLNLGSLHLHRDAYAASARHYREAAVLFARGGQMQHSVMADIGVADAITAQGDFEEAAHMYSRARQRAKHHALPVLAAIVDESIALLDLARGHYQPALAGLERARRSYEELAMPQQLVLAEKQLADAYLALRLLPEALGLYEAALPRFEALEMQPEQAWTLAQRGRAQALLGQWEAAEDTLRDAGARFAGQDNAVGEADVALVRAELAAARGDAAQSLALAEAAGRGFGGASQAQGQLRAELARAQALLALGEVASAQSAFAASGERAAALGLLPQQVQSLTGQGLVARAQGDDTAARAAFEAAVAQFEDQRQALVGEEFRQSMLADGLQPYRELLDMSLHPPGGGPADARDVLLQLERVRARSLGERLTGALPVDTDPELPALRGRLNWLTRRLRKAQDEGTPLQSLVDELRRTERDLLERVRRERLARAGPGADGPRDGGVDLQALCHELGEHDALVEYGVCGDELLACVVRHSGVGLVRHLARWSEVLEALQSAQFQIDALRHGSAPLARHLPHLQTRATQRLQRLHAMLWAPLQPSLAGCTRALVVAHGPLAALPFAALHDGRAWLGQSLQLALAASARVALRGLLRRSATPQRTLRRALVVGESTRLPQARAEALHVAALFAQAACLVDEAATLQALRAAAPAADVIHLACHAQFRSDNPLFSALHLHDGAVTAQWLQGLALRPAVVVLSACETGLAHQGQGDEMIGLVRAFLVCGAARVVAALWPVDDAVTARFMEAFYRELTAGAECALALQRAQQAVMQAHPHPFYWAGFALQGGW